MCGRNWGSACDSIFTALCIHCSHQQITSNPFPSINLKCLFQGKAKELLTRAVAVWRVGRAVCSPLFFLNRQSWIQGGVPFCLMTASLFCPVAAAETHRCSDSARFYIFVQRQFMFLIVIAVFSYKSSKRWTCALKTRGSPLNCLTLRITWGKSTFYVSKCIYLLASV